MFNNKIMKKLQSIGPEATLTLGYIHMFLNQAGEYLMGDNRKQAMWAIKLMLENCQYQEQLTDLTLELMRQRPQVTNSIGRMCEIALTGASKKELEKLVAPAVEYFYDPETDFWVEDEYAQRLIDKLGREFTPQEVRLMGPAYKRLPICCGTMEDKVEAVYRRVLGEEGVAEFQKYRWRKKNTE